MAGRLMRHSSTSTAAAAEHVRIRPRPGVFVVQEPVVANLASIYELAAPVQGTELKRAMAKWISAAAPDDFDLTATKII